MEFIPTTSVYTVLCADCGIPIISNSANLCVNCLRNTVDITEDIPKQSSVSFCRNCERFLSPSQNWIPARPESSELLSICLKKLKGLSKVRLTEAHFIWTEPHSKRLRVSLTIQKEVLTSTVLEQVFEVEYLVQHTQCGDCSKLAAKNTWKALVQIRQKVTHKKTFLFLEQLIIKHGAHKETISVKEVKDGLDFFYSQRNHAIKMVSFLAGVVPVRSKASERLLSSDTHSNTANFKFTYSVEIAPLCKDDLVCLPTKLAKQLSNINPLTLVLRAGQSIQLMNTSNLQLCDLSSQMYWRMPFDALATYSDLVEFTVLDVECTELQSGRWLLADAQVAVSGAFKSLGIHEHAELDYESRAFKNQIFHTRTHLGAIIQPGDTVLGYHITNANYNSDEFAALPSSEVPDVVLVKKSYPNQRKKNKARNWRLRSIAKEKASEEVGEGRGFLGRTNGKENKKADEDYELFLRDLEEDPEMRAAVNLYKGKQHKDIADASPTKGQMSPMDVDFEDGEDEADFPEVKLDELLDDFDQMTLEEA